MSLEFGFVLSVQGIVHGAPDGLVVKNPPANAGDLGSILGLGRFPGEGNGNPLQNSGLETTEQLMLKHDTHIFMCAYIYIRVCSVAVMSKSL